MAKGSSHQKHFKKNTKILRTLNKFSKSNHPAIHTRLPQL